MIKSGNGGGRLGNHFFRNIVTFLLSSKYKIDSEYSQIEKFHNLGLFFDKHSKKYNSKNKSIKYLSENDVINYLETNNNSIHNHINSLNRIYCQEPKIVKYIVNYFSQINNSQLDSDSGIYSKFHNLNELCQDIIKNNKFKERYNNNKDIFIHIRLGDVSVLSFTIEYYENILDNTIFEKGYLSSDSLTHPLCVKLIEKYNLNKIEYDEIDTILFGSTCDQIILSAGSFSFMIGLFGFYSSKIYYNSNAGKGWHPLYYSQLGGVNQLTNHETINQLPNRGSKYISYST